MSRSIPGTNSYQYATLVSALQNATDADLVRAVIREVEQRAPSAARRGQSLDERVMRGWVDISRKVEAAP